MDRKLQLNDPQSSRVEERPVRVTAGPVTLEGDLTLPEGAGAVVLFAHGSGSSRHSPRNRYVARVLNEAKLATLLIDLLTPDEEADRLRHGAPALRYRAARASGSSARRTGSRSIPIRGTFRSAISAPAPAPPRRWWRRPSVPMRSAPSSREAAGPIWPGRPCRACVRPRCSSSAATTSGHRAEPGSACAAALRKATGDRAGGNASVRRAWRARRGGAAGARMVSAPSQRINVLGGAACPSTKPVRLVPATECRLTFVKADEEQVDTIVTSTSCAACD